jgi:AcrR family transcriptional regulator
VIEIQRARMLAAMVEVCSERGAANVTVADVVERAGVSRRTFYEVFEDCEDCFLAAFDDAIARASKYIDGEYIDGEHEHAGDKWVERVRMGLTGLLSFLEAERDAGQLLIAGSLGAGARALERRRCVVARLIAVVDEGRKQASAGEQSPPLTAEGIVGGVLSVLHSRLLDRSASVTGVTGREEDSLLGLSGALMSMIVLPYLGPAAARRELARPLPHASHAPSVVGHDPLRELGMRLTYRTVRVLMAVATTPGGSNRQLGDGSGIVDQGQISKLLARLHGLGLIDNTGAGSVRGAPNSWVLTAKGWEVQGALSRNIA